MPAGSPSRSSRATSATRTSRTIIARLQARGRRHPRHDGLFPGDAGHPDFDAREPRAVPVHAGRPPTATRCSNGPTSSCAAARQPGAARGRLGGAGRRPARAGRRRPRAGRTARRLDAERHRHAQRRLRPAADFDHLRPGQPVPRHPGGAAALPAGPQLAVEALRHRRQHLDRHGGDRRQHRDRHHQYQHHRHAQRGHRQQPGAARRLRAFRARPRRRSRSRTRSSSPRSPSASICAPGYALSDAVAAIRAARTARSACRRR